MFNNISASLANLSFEQQRISNDEDDDLPLKRDLEKVNAYRNNLMTYLRKLEEK